jgi:hypothetical protein
MKAREREFVSVSGHVIAATALHAISVMHSSTLSRWLSVREATIELKTRDNAQLPLGSIDNSCPT